MTKLALRLALACSCALALACDSDDADGADAAGVPEPGAAPAADSSAPTGEAEPAPASEEGGAAADGGRCSFDPWFTDPCLLGLETYKEVLGVDDPKLHLQPNPSKGLCALADGGTTPLILLEVKRSTEKGVASFVEDFETMEKIGHGAPVDLQAGDCPAFFREKIYDVLMIAGDEATAVIKVRVPDIESEGPLTKEQQTQRSADRRVNAEKLGRAYAARLRAG